MRDGEAGSSPRAAWRRLAATVTCDARLQVRNGFYYAVAFILVAWAIVIASLPALDLALWLPAILLGNLSMATFFFTAAVVLLEKGERTLEAQVVTPLPVSVYLASKLVTLTALSLVESVVIVAITSGAGFRLPALVAGVVAASTIYCLCGFLAVVRYDSINEFLFPSMVWITALSIPFLVYTGLWTSPIAYLHPLQPALELLRGGFQPLTPQQWLYGVGGSSVWIGALFGWSRRRFHRFVTQTAGGVA